jgi:hypothetical protein
MQSRSAATEPLSGTVSNNAVLLADALTQFTDPAFTEALEVALQTWEAAGRPANLGIANLAARLAGGSGILKQSHATVRAVHQARRLRTDALQAEWTDDPTTQPWQSFPEGAWKYLRLVDSGLAETTPMVVRRQNLPGAKVSRTRWLWVRVRLTESGASPEEPTATNARAKRGRPRKGRDEIVKAFNERYPTETEFVRGRLIAIARELIDGLPEKNRPKANTVAGGLSKLLRSRLINPDKR